MFVAQVPLADHGGGVACGLQHLCDGDLFVGKAKGGAGSDGVGQVHTGGVAAGEQGGPGRGTGGAGHDIIGGADACTGDGVQEGCLDDGAAIAAQIRVSMSSVRMKMMLGRWGLLG